MFDWSNLNGGIQPAAQSLHEAWQRLKSRFDSAEVGFFASPGTESISRVRETTELARKLIESRKFTDCLFLGIGGSALGPVSLLEALSDRCSTGLRFHFKDNVDPIDWKRTMARLHPDTTLVVCATKSGTTFETVAQFLIALQWLGQERWSSQVVAITDPEKGDLRKFARQHDISCLEIDPSIGGRFSIFSPVGLFPAALAGLDVQAFLKGAQQVREHADKGPVEKNPLFQVGHELIRQFPQRPIHVCMPYSSALKSIGAWFVQLWGESLGKDGKGFTPLAAVGATDQHSILQLLRDGPDDKVTWFLTIDRVDDEIAIPRTITGFETSQLPSFAQLQGHSLQALLNTEYQSTALVLSRRKRPHLRIQLDRLDERSLGALYFSLCLLTAVTGTLWGLNPFDQPGVEEGKVLIREALASRRAEAWAEEDPNSPVGRLRRE